MQKLLITLGFILLVLGLIWPWLQKVGLFKLPGDVVIERENFRFYFPITTAIIISLVVSLIIWLLRR
ncbi:MAG: DUF2905 domain-containing protein [Gammaproteobacteria bacterium]|nr:MAG: DUF2905 domain-containing protein [Gammaproteobacteria bacterium]